MDRDLLIDLGASPSTEVKESENELIGFLDVTANLPSCKGVVGNTSAVNPMATDILKEVRTTCSHEGDGAISVMKFKAQSVDSLSDLNSLGVLPLPGSPAVARRQLSVNLEQMNSSKLLSPFTTPKPKSTTSLPTVSLLDDEPAKLLSPFGWTPKRNDQRTLKEPFYVEDVPVGDLVQVQETECKLPDDMFDIDTLGKKQLEHSKAQPSVKPAPTVHVLLPSLSSIGSEDMNSNDTLNRGFLGSLSDESGLFPTPNDSVFEEAQELAKMFEKMGAPVSSNTMDSIEDEDGSIVYDCPDYKDDILVSEISRMSCLDPYQKAWEKFSNESMAEKEEEEAMNDRSRKYSLALSGIVSQGSGCDSFDGSSSISAFSPSPLSIGSVESLKLKTKSLMGNQLSTFPLKLRASSCSAVPSSKPGPIKAFMPLGQVIKDEVSTPLTAGACRKSLVTGTPHLQVMNSPLEGVNLMRRMSSTPKPHILDNSGSGSKINVNNGSSLKKPIGNKLNKREQVFNNGTKKPGGTTLAPTRQSSSGKPPENQNGNVKGGVSAKRSPANSTRASTGSVGIEASVSSTKGSKHYPSPLLRRKTSNSPSAMKTPSRSISTGSLCSTSSTKKVINSPQVPNLLSKGRSNSSSKLPLSSSGRPLTETSVNSPAKHSSPLQKLVSKFRRNFTPREMKENMQPM